MVIIISICFRVFISRTCLRTHSVSRRNVSKSLIELLVRSRVFCVNHISDLFGVTIFLTSALYLNLPLHYNTKLCKATVTAAFNVTTKMPQTLLWFCRRAFDFKNACDHYCKSDSLWKHFNQSERFIKLDRMRLYGCAFFNQSRSRFSERVYKQPVKANKIHILS